MLTAEQIEQRRGKITASVVPAILGLSPWEGSLGAFLRITGRHVDEQNDFTNAGNRFEKYLLQEAAAEDGVQTWTPGVVQHPKIEWLAATPDAAVTGPFTTLYEAKLVGAYTSEHWDNGVPAYVAAQCAVQMACTCAREVHVVALVGGNRYKRDTIVRDFETESMILEECERFYRNHILPDVAPEWDGLTTAARLQQLYGMGNGKLSQAPSAADALVSAYREASLRESQAKADKEAAKMGLIAIIGEADGIESDGYKVTWKERAECVIPTTTRAAYRHFDVREKKAKR